MKFTVSFGFYNCILLNLNSFPGLFSIQILNHHDTWDFFPWHLLTYHSQKKLYYPSPNTAVEGLKNFSSGLRVESRKMEKDDDCFIFMEFYRLEKFSFSLLHSYWTQSPVSRTFIKNSLSLFDSFLLVAKL